MSCAFLLAEESCWEAFWEVGNCYCLAGDRIGECCDGLCQSLWSDEFGVDVHCVSGVITAPTHSTGRSRILLETICGHHCDQTDPQYGNSVGDTMVPVSSSVACCFGECRE